MDNKVSAEYAAAAEAAYDVFQKFPALMRAAYKVWDAKRKAGASILCFDLWAKSCLMDFWADLRNGGYDGGTDSILAAARFNWEGHPDFDVAADAGRLCGAEVEWTAYVEDGDCVVVFWVDGDANGLSLALDAVAKAMLAIGWEGQHRDESRGLLEFCIPLRIWHEACGDAE